MLLQPFQKMFLLRHYALRHTRRIEPFSIANCRARTCGERTARAT